MLSPLRTQSYATRFCFCAPIWHHIITSGLRQCLLSAEATAALSCGQNRAKGVSNGPSCSSKVQFKDMVTAWGTTEELARAVANESTVLMIQSMPKDNSVSSKTSLFVWRCHLCFATLWWNKQVATVQLQRSSKVLLVQSHPFQGMHSSRHSLEFPQVQGMAQSAKTANIIGIERCTSLHIALSNQDKRKHVISRLRIGNCMKI